MDLVTPSRISSKAVWHDLLPSESSGSQYNLNEKHRRTKRCVSKATGRARPQLKQVVFMTRRPFTCLWWYWSRSWRGLCWWRLGGHGWPCQHQTHCRRLSPANKHKNTHTLTSVAFTVHSFQPGSVRAEVHEWKKKPKNTLMLYSRSKCNMYWSM